MALLALSLHPCACHRPTEPSSNPHCRPRPSMEGAARNDGVAADKAPLDEEKVGYSSANGANGFRIE